TFFERHRFTGQHRFVERAIPFNDFAIHRNLLTRPDAKLIADMHFNQRRVNFLTIANNMRFLRREIEKRAYGAASSSPCAQLEDRADPKPTGHVAQLGILFFVARNLSFRLKRHAADWAIARMILFDLRMHWTRVDHLIGQPCLPDWTRESPESVNSFEDLQEP